MGRLDGAGWHVGTRGWNWISGWIRSRYLGITFLVVVLAAVFTPLLARRSSAVSQPVPFNHNKHTQDLGLKCEFCHQYVLTGAHSGLPGAEICAICHSTPQGESEASATVTELIAAGDSFHFRKLFRMPSHVFYTHRRHVAIAELECNECHGPIAETERSPDRPFVKVTMEFCTDCHSLRGQSVDCNACHR